MAKLAVWDFQPGYRTRPQADQRTTIYRRRAFLDHLACFTPDDLLFSSTTSFTLPLNLGAYRWKLLAQGDSWFSKAAAPQMKHTNVLQEMVFKQPACAINCAAVGRALTHLVDLVSNPDFVALLTRPDAPVWDGLLLSVGGNDLITAAQIPGLGADGQEIPLHLRLLRRPAEWGSPSQGVARYFSEPGWATLAAYLRTNIRHLLSLRDQGPSAGKPVFMHCYAVPMPRPAGSEDAGPWLYPTLKAYALPSADWAAISRLMVFHLAQLLKTLAADKLEFPNLHVFDSTAVPLAPANQASTSSSGDWHNEVHLNHSGSFKIARAWAEPVEMVLAGIKPAEPPKKRGRAAKN